MDDYEYVSYEEFGRKFYEIAVTEERVGGAIAAIAGDEFEMGPMGQGPGKIAKVTAKVRIQEPRVTRSNGELITFAIRIPLEMGPMGQGPGKIAKVTAKVRIQEPRVTRSNAELITFAIRIPLEIDMVIDLRIDKPKFMVFGEIALSATARAAEPLLLILDVQKPRPSDISIHVTSKSLRGELLRILAGVDAEVRRFIAAHVAGEIDSPASVKAKVIHVADLIDVAWTGV